MMKKMGRREPQEDTGGEQTLGSDGPPRGVLATLLLSRDFFLFLPQRGCITKVPEKSGCERGIRWGEGVLTWVSDAHSDTGQGGRGPQRDRLPDGHAATLADPTVHRKSL